MMFLSLLVVTTAGIGTYAWTIYGQSTDELSKTYKGLGNETDVISATKPMTILLMGVDTGSGSREDTWVGNSDTMILLSVNPKTKKTVMMSLERDILTQIDENGQTVEAKLNAAYATGGAELAISTIEGLMNIHIDRYVMINMQEVVLRSIIPLTSQFLLRIMSLSILLRLSQASKPSMVIRRWSMLACVIRILRVTMAAKSVNVK